MRMKSWTILAALCVAPIASAQSGPEKLAVDLPGQPAASPVSIANSPDPAIGAVVSAVMPKSGGLGAVKGVPFSATQTTVREQTLADGTVIKSTVEVQLARDSDGRIRAESTLKQKSTDATQSHVVAVWNPTDRTEISWVTGNPHASFANVLHLPELQLNGMMGALASAPPPPPGSLSHSLHTVPVAQSSVPSRDAASIHTETLSTDTIASLEVTGTRTTQVVPAGTIGNDRDFTVTSETWVSPELKVTVRQLTSDPRTGTVTTELTNIDRSDPDPALFKPPAGYKTMDLPNPLAADSGAKR
jgi:hypothetical protein